jgi:hypothetical protein
MSRYTKILTRLREATGPDRKLDAAIIKALFPRCRILPYSAYTIWCREPGKDWGWEKLEGLTASIDAVFALIGEMLPGWNWGVYKIAAEVFFCVLSPPPTHPNCIMDVVAESQKCTAPLAILTTLFHALEAQEVEK